MKSFLKNSGLALVVFLSIGLSTKQVKAQYDDVSLQTFYDELSPYGTWINDPQYGYVWRPDVDQAEFRPYYSNGRWVMTEYGNTWVSNYEWGWAPFHYGRWLYTRYNRWVWLPDTVWGPAWVSWRSGGGYYGWAPLGPSISIDIHIGRRYEIPSFCWNFIPAAHIYYSNYPRYYSGRNNVYIQKTVIINNTYIQNNRTYYTGPRVADIRRYTRNEVKVYNVSRSTNRNSSGIQDRQVNIYTPRPNRASENTRPQPNRVVQADISRERVSYSRNNNSASDIRTGQRVDRGHIDDSNISGREAERNNWQSTRTNHTEIENTRTTTTESRNVKPEYNNRVSRGENRPQTIMSAPSRTEGRINTGSMYPEQSGRSRVESRSPQRVESGRTSRGDAGNHNVQSERRSRG